MSNSFGYLDIILLAMIAGFIILRLRNILGRKTGHQEKAFSDFADKKFEQFKKASTVRDTKPKNEFDAKDKKQFLKGAEIAYETILTSFSKGDKENLKTLLTEKMQNNFSSAIEDRKAKKIKSELTFVGIKSSAIENFEKTAEALYFTVKFVSEIISVKKDKDNKVVEGDPNKIRTVIDHSNKKFKFDFHGYTIEKANLTIEKIISKCYENGVNEILVITGKGIHSKDNDVYSSSEYNRLKSTIPLFIKNEPGLSSKIKNIKTAPSDKGGEGALIIKFKKSIK